MFKIIGSFILCVYVIGIDGDPHYAQESKLKESLLSGYDKTVPPLVDMKQNITVSFGLALIAIDNLDAERGVLTTHVWLRMSWQDARLTWDPATYGDRDTISIPSALVWQPDMVPYNSAHQDYSPSADFHTVVSSSGDVHYIPHVLLATSCDVDLTNFPFDKQTCNIKFGSWTYSGNVITLTDFGFDTSDYLKNKMWTIVNATSNVTAQKYECCPEKYYDWKATLVLQRTTSLIMNMYSGPAVCMGLLVPLVFLLPAGSSHKLILGSGLLISQMLLLDMLAEVLPINDFTAPRLAMYYLTNIVLISLSLVLSVVTISLWERAKRAGDGIPAVVNQVILGVFGRLLCVKRQDFIVELDTENTGKTDQRNMDDQANMMREYTRLVAPAEWRQLSVVLDRLLLVVFLMVALATVIALMAYPAAA